MVYKPRIEPRLANQILMNIQTITGNRVCLFLRVSTTKQDYDRQMTELTAYCVQRGFKTVHTIASVVTGSRTYDKRPDLQELFALADQGIINRVVVTEVSRIGRNAKDIWHTLRYLHARGISVVFKSLGGIESLDENGQETFVTNVIIGIYAELAQEEKKILSERIRSGLEHARKKGQRLGRPEGLGGTEELLKRYPGLAKDVKSGLSLRKCEKVHSVSRCTVIKVKRAVFA